MQSPGPGVIGYWAKGYPGVLAGDPHRKHPHLKASVGAEVAPTPSPGFAVPSCHTLVGLSGALPTFGVARTLCPTPTTSRSAERETLGKLGCVVGLHALGIRGQRPTNCSTVRTIVPRGRAAATRHPGGSVGRLSRPALPAPPVTLRVFFCPFSTLDTQPSPPSGPRCLP